MKYPLHWTPADREEYEERAAILEYDGGYSREEAEAKALLQTEERVLRKIQGEKR